MSWLRPWERARCWRNCKNEAQLIQQVDSQWEPLIEIETGLSLVVRYNGWFYFACYKLSLFNPFFCFVFLFSSIKHADNNRATAALFKTSASCDRLPTSASLFDDSDSRIAIIVADFSNTLEHLCSYSSHVSQFTVKLCQLGAKHACCLRGMPQ